MKPAEPIRPTKTRDVSILQFCLFLIWDAAGYVQSAPWLSSFIPLIALVGLYLVPPDKSLPIFVKYPGIHKAYRISVVMLIAFYAFKSVAQFFPDFM